jgi:hypothetical protein
MKLSDDGYWKKDAITQSEILADAAQIAAWTGRPVETVAGQPGVRFDAEQPPILEFSRQRWTGVPMISWYWSWQPTAERSNRICSFN